MYGTVGRVKVKPGRFDDAVELMREWERDFRPKVKGAKGAIAYRLDSDPNTMIFCAIFSDKDSYVANAGSPEQDKWFRRFRDLCEADPEWNDGEIVYQGA